MLIYLSRKNDSITHAKQLSSDAFAENQNNLKEKRLWKETLIKKNMSISIIFHSHPIIFQRDATCQSQIRKNMTFLRLTTIHRIFVTAHSWGTWFVTIVFFCLFLIRQVPDWRRTIAQFFPGSFYSASFLHSDNDEGKRIDMNGECKSTNIIRFDFSFVRGSKTMAL